MKNTKSSSSTALILGLVGLTAFLSTAQAATIGYWRFEDDVLTDSSGNGNTLSVITGATKEAIPVSGNGSEFSSPIPQTGDSNGSMASFNGSGSLSVADPFGASGLGSFTAEAYINLGSTSSNTQYVMSQYDANNGDRSWGLGIADSNGTLSAGANEMYLLVSPDGDNPTTLLPLGLTLTTGVDYYIAFSFDGSTGTNDVTFYYQDLTNGGTLMSTIGSSTMNKVFDSSAKFRISGTGNTNIGGKFTGDIDEVKISDTVLSSSELLIAIPESSTLSLFSFAGLALVFGLRGRKRLHGKESV
ncbi:hypothetical protein P3T73_01010 [Kiritimatiellota bacterium B12222]|nr:hypothetical protein P3T73_01010 [Kiritimatiellota bacterium B12222]